MLAVLPRLVLPALLVLVHRHDPPPPLTPVPDAPVLAAPELA